MEVIDPSSAKVVKNYPPTPADEIPEILEAVHNSWLTWRRTDFEYRAELLKKVASRLRNEKNSLAELMCLEMGKPISQGISEAEKCAWVCEYYADNAEQFLANQPTATDASNSYVTFQPIGIVLAVMPWNFPLWQVFRFAAPALMAGNAGVLKHASNVPGCALAIERLFREAGLPEHIFRTLLIGSKQVADVIAHPLVKAVTLTGSTPAGKSVASQAGSYLKKTVLELGGSDPYIILEDADLAQAAKTCATSRMINNGQSCIAAKRFIVVEEVYEQFKELMVQEMAQYTMGDPMSNDTKLGPMARTDLRNELHQQVQASIEKGAICLLGGQVPDKPGAWYPATVLENVQPGMPAYEEELFGPVASLIKVSNEAEAIEVANATDFGLGAAVFTADKERGQRIAETELQAGAAFVNEFVRSDPRLPFGGIKQSGYGRELSPFGILEFVNVKTVYVR